MKSEAATEAEDAQQPAGLPPGGADHQPEEIASDPSNYENVEPKSEKTSDEIRGMMEVIAATGKFCYVGYSATAVRLGHKCYAKSGSARPIPQTRKKEHDWDMLKSLLSIRLKQVLSEYPEAKVFSGDGPQPSSLSGETYPELVRRLDEEGTPACLGFQELNRVYALLSFTEGPPFTLQRLCEILLTPKSTYGNLSKLALALEKNLLVTSTLTICCDPYPTSVTQEPAKTEKSEELQGRADAVPNGVENMAADVDEEMVEADIDEDAPSEETDPQNIDTEMQVESVSEASERSTESSDPTPPIEICTTEQKNTGTPQEP